MDAAKVVIGVIDWIIMYLTQIGHFANLWS